MNEEERKPQTQSAGAVPPPRPPTRTAIGLAPDDDDDSVRRQKKETVRINLRPKPVAIPTINLPSGGPKGPPSIVHPKQSPLGELTTGHTPPLSARTNKFISAALVLTLQAVLMFEAYASIDRTTAVSF